MSKLLSQTQSVCPVCLRVIEARRVVGEDGCIYLEKSCPAHGDFSALIWEGDEESYLRWGNMPSPSNKPPIAKESREGCPHDCGFCEAHESAGCCVLLELTKRCDLRCPVCFASAGETQAEDASLREIGALYDMLMQRGGPFNIQLSGGEPTMRDDLPEIIALGREKGFSFFQLNTNGIRIAKEQGYAQKLKAGGVSCVFLQFDGLSEESYRLLRGRELLQTKLQAIERCEEARLPVVLVPTLAPGVNEDELGDILRFALARMPAVRGVHFQPVSYFGRCSLAPNAKRLTIPRLLREIEAQTGGLMKAEHFGGGGAESPYCSFHASYMKRADDRLLALSKKQTSCCCAKSSEARDFVARQWGLGAPSAAFTEAPMSETSSLDAFLAKAQENTFTVSGMLFQDAWTLDLARLRRCYISEADMERGMVPFCAYNLTSSTGKALYRR